MVPSEKIPVAVSCRVVPLAIEGFGGRITMEVNTAGVTVTVTAPDTPAWVAVILAVPTPAPVTRPGFMVLATVAMFTADELQLAEAVMSCVL